MSDLNFFASGYAGGTAVFALFEGEPLIGSLFFVLSFINILVGLALHD